MLVVDAHAVVASALAAALGHAGFGRVATVAPEDLEVGGDPRAAGLGAGDIALVSLLSGDGRTAVPLIRPLADRGCRVVVMTSDQGLPLSGECLRRGAEAVVGRAMPFDRLVEVLRRLCAGGRAMTDDERAAFQEAVERYEAVEEALHRPFAALTDREAEVFAALVTGLAPKQIAQCSGTKVSTVRGHIQRVLNKLDVHNQREALAMARNAGWPAPAARP